MKTLDEKELATFTNEQLRQAFITTRPDYRIIFMNDFLEEFGLNLIHHRITTLQFVAGNIDFDPSSNYAIIHLDSDNNILDVDSAYDITDYFTSIVLNDALQEYVKLDNANPTTVQNYHKLTQVDTLETVLGTIDSQEDSFKETITSKNVEELTGDNIDCLHEYETAKRIILDFEMYYHDGAQEHTLDTIKVFDKDNLADRVQDHDIQLSYLASPDDKTALWYRVISSNVYHTIKPF